jgi:hypothetical protein
VDRLLVGWDDAVAEQLFAVNVDLDEPLPRRRARIERVVAAFGPLTPDESQPVEHTSPAHCRWWLAGPGGRGRAEILLTPQHPPRVQSLSLVTVPQAPLAVRAVAEAVVSALAAPDPRWPAELSTAVDLDRAGLTRLLRLASSWAGACDLAEVLSGDGVGLATFRLVGERAGLAMTVGVDPAAAVAVRPGDPTGPGAAVCRFALALAD